MKLSLSFALILLLLIHNTSNAQQPAANTDNNSPERARALLKAGKLAEADSALRNYLAQHVDSVEAHFLLGYILFLEQKPKESLEQYTAGAHGQRPSPGDLTIVSFDYVLLDDYADADKWLSVVVAETPQDARAWYLLGRARYNENHFAEAIDAFTHALQLNPHDVKSENNLGLSYEGLNKIDDAQKAYTLAIQWQQASVTKSAQPYLNLGILLVEQGKPEQALPHLEQAAALEPANPKMHEQLGRAYQVLNMLPQAKQELRKAIELAPNSSSLHFRLGQIDQHLGLKEEAQVEFAVCAKLNSTHSSVDTPNPGLTNQTSPVSQ